ncbi:MAG: hypothetical protein FWD76_06375, partial [Firmicutes bacterium]|nr:hypothetical protein [Bacillota bacterium]
MKIEVRFGSGHKVKEIAETLAKELGEKVIAKSVTEPMDDDVDVVFLGGSGGFGVEKAVKKFVKNLDKKRIKALSPFGMSAKHSAKKIAKFAKKNGLDKVVGELAISEFDKSKHSEDIKTFANQTLDKVSEILKKVESLDKQEVDMKKQESDAETKNPAEHTTHTSVQELSQSVQANAKLESGDLHKEETETNNVTEPSEHTSVQELSQSVQANAKLESGDLHKEETEAHSCGAGCEHCHCHDTYNTDNTD